MRNPSEFDAGIRYDRETGRLVRRLINLPTILDGAAEDPTEAEVFGPDTRQPITDTTRVPYRFICHLAINWMDENRHTVDEQSDGTGILVGNRHVLTAGHCIKHRSKHLRKSVFAQSITVTPGKNTAAPAGRWSPFGSYVVAEPKVAAKQWLESYDTCYDFALLTLKEDVGSKVFKATGNRPLGYWGSKKNGGDTRIDVLPPASLLGKSVFAAGYPFDKCGANPMGKICLPPGRGGGTPFIASDIVADLSPRNKPLQLRYRSDIKKGQSGGPVWLVDKASRQLQLVAINRGELYTERVNEGVLITADVIGQLRSWGCLVCGS